MALFSTVYKTFVDGGSQCPNYIRSRNFVNRLAKMHRAKPGTIFGQNHTHNLESGTAELTNSLVGLGSSPISIMANGYFVDSMYRGDPRLIDIVDDEWRTDKLPHEDIIVPPTELPDPEADNADSHMTLKEQEQKWLDLALSHLGEAKGPQQI